MIILGRESETQPHIGAVAVLGDTAVEA